MLHPCLEEAFLYMSFWDPPTSESIHSRTTPSWTDCSLGLSTKTCAISSLYLVLDNEECLLHFFARLFHIVSEDYLLHELGLV